MESVLDFVVNIFNGLFDCFDVPFFTFPSFSMLILSIVLFFLILKIFIGGGKN